MRTGYKKQFEFNVVIFVENSTGLKIDVSADGLDVNCCLKFKKIKKKIGV